MPGLKSLGWVDNTYHFRWIIPLNGNENKIGNRSLLDEIPNTIDISTIKKHNFTIYQLNTLPHEPDNFVFLYPVKSHDLFDGFLVCTFNIKEFLSEALSYYSSRYYIISLRHNDTEYFKDNDLATKKISKWTINLNLKLLDKVFDLSITPKPKVIQRYHSFFPITLLISGLLASFLVALIVKYLFTMKAKAQDLVKANFLINNILRSPQHLIIATDVNGTVISFNEAAEKALGYTAEEIIGKHTPAIWHDSMEVAARAIQLSTELGVPISPGFDVFVAKAQRGITETLEWTLIRKDSSRFPARLTPTTLRENNRIIGYLGVLEDISEYKKAEKELREFRIAMENAIEGTAKLDLSGCYTFVNEAYAKTIGYKPEELIGRQWEMTVHPDDRAFMIAEYERMLKVGKVSPEARGIRKDGSVFYKQLTMVSNINEKGEVIGHFCFMKDISEQKENAERISLLAAIVEFSEDAMISKSLNGTITAWNKGAEKIFGYTAEEIIGKNIKTLISPDRLSEEKTILESTLKGESIRQMESIYMKKNGEYLNVSLTISPIFDNNRNIIGASKVARDITERKRQEKEMELLTEKLLKSNTELERFAYIASHDLQEPIRMIINFSDIIVKDYEDVLDDQGKEYLKFVKNGGIRMREMIDDLLSYSRLSNNDDRMKAFKGESILGEIQENLKTLLNEKKVKLTHDKLPELYGNPVQILRLLQNLIVNAIKYQPKNNIPEIHISAEENEEYWCISVRDNGLGIKPEFIDTIFQPFKRLHTWDSISGTGLGLAICKKIVENHNGTIKVKSEFGKGSVFSFFIAKNLNNKGLK